MGVGKGEEGAVGSGEGEEGAGEEWDGSVLSKYQGLRERGTASLPRIAEAFRPRCVCLCRTPPAPPARAARMHVQKQQPAPTLKHQMVLIINVGLCGVACRSALDGPSPGLAQRLLALCREMERE